MQPFVNWCYWIFIARTWNNVPPKWLSRRLVDCLLILLNARAYLNIAIESRFAPMMLLAVFKKVQYKLLMHRLAQMNVRFALMNSKRCNCFLVELFLKRKCWTRLTIYCSWGFEKCWLKFQLTHTKARSTSYSPFMEKDRTLNKSRISTRI